MNHVESLAGSDSFAQLKDQRNLAEASVLKKRSEVRKSVPKETPPDSLECVSGQLRGTGYYYILENGRLVLQRITFRARADRPLSPFHYKKPLLTGDIFQPTEMWEHSERAQCYPLAIVHNAYRGPHHYHRPDDALFCAVRVENHWETRYFPKHNLSLKIWQEAVEMLNVEETEQPEVEVGGVYTHVYQGQYQVESLVRVKVVDTEEKVDDVNVFLDSTEYEQTLEVKRVKIIQDETGVAEEYVVYTRLDAVDFPHPPGAVGTKWIKKKANFLGTTRVGGQVVANFLPVK